MPKAFQKMRSETQAQIDVKVKRKSKIMLFVLLFVHPYFPVDTLAQ